MMTGETAFFGNIWISQFHMPQKGAEIDQHEHVHDHVSLLVSGSVCVQMEDGSETIFNAPSIVLIRKNLKHKIISLSDDTLWYCVFALRDVDGNPVDQYDEDNLPDIDPTFFGAETLAVYKELYTDSQEVIKDLQIKNSDLELKYQRLAKLVKNRWYSNSINIELE